MRYGRGRKRKRADQRVDVVKRSRVLLEARMNALLSEAWRVGSQLAQLQAAEQGAPYPKSKDGAA